MQLSLDGLDTRMDEKVRMALRWYIRALDLPYIVDKFMALWTAAEILWERSGDRVTAPYVAPACGHRVTLCPICLGPIDDRLVRGKSIQAYLRQISGPSEIEVEQLWEMRQVVHGKNVFRSDRIDELDKLCGQLKYLVFRALRNTLDWPEEAGPQIIDQQFHFPTRLYGGGSRHITEFDLAVDAAQQRAISS